MDAPKEKQCNLCYCIWCKITLPQRICMITMLVLVTMVQYGQRGCLSMAIVHMTKTTEGGHGGRCKLQTGNATEKPLRIVDPQYDWDESLQSYILLSFFFGYMIGNVVIGLIIEVTGGRWCLLGGTAISSFLTLTLPFLAFYMHWGFICASRAITGFAQTSLTACCAELLARWCLEDKKSSATTVVLSSFNFGIIFGNVGSAYIMELTHTWSWVFYIFGIVGLLWCVMFFFYGFSYPEAHPHITPKELEYLGAIPKPEKRKMPAKRIFSDVAVWTFFIAYLGSDFTLYLIITNMPKYFVDVLGYSSALTGLILMGPPLCGVVGSVLFGLLSDWIIGKKYMKKTHFRMIHSVLGLPICSGCLLVMAMVECNVGAAIAMVCLSMFLKAAYYAGVGAMAMDLSINYTGLLYGCSNVAGGFAGAIAPYIIGSVAYDNTFPQWKCVHCVTVAFATVVLIPILLFSKVERKDWDYGPDEAKPPVDDAPAFKRVWSWYKAV